MWILKTNYLITVGFLLLMVACGTPKLKDKNKVHFDQPSEYHDYINTRFENVSRLWNSTLHIMDDSSKIYLQLDSLEQAALTYFEDMNRLADFKGDTLYRHAAREYFLYMYTVSKGSYREAIQIGLMGDDIPDSLQFRFNLIGDQIGADKDSCINRLINANLNFMRFASE